MSDEHTGQPGQRSDEGATRESRIVVVTQDGMGVSSPTGPSGSSGSSAAGGAGHEQTNPADLVEQPAKVMRIGSMIKNLLEEVRNAPLDEAGRTRLAEIHTRSIHELKAGLAPELVDELDRISLPFTEAAPSDAELRIAQAQLVGWLEGLFHGIQTALFAQQMAAQQQLQGMRRALPPGQGGGPEGGAGPDGGASGPFGAPTGQYL
ncbi:bacterial proteasome activator family protein [Lapillicoccus sp.]|uniref:bacterial proteasome activator family protein n=1 Tax=Lapillicoccus sp. TaxID=1909287 RepID=UPI0025D814A8|nr:bacterial proteasome activator family protein [Lapillicoccus sp.]